MYGYASSPIAFRDMVIVPLRTRARHLRNGRALLAEAGRLFERVRHLQDAEVFLVAADDLHANRKSFRREAARHRGRRISRCRDIPAGLHPVDVVIELHTRDFRWIWRVDIKWRQLRRGQNEVLVLFEKCLKAPPELAVGSLGACRDPCRSVAALPRFSLLRVSLNASGCSCSRAPIGIAPNSMRAACERRFRRERSPAPPARRCTPAIQMSCDVHPPRCARAGRRARRPGP